MSTASKRRLNQQVRETLTRSLVNYIHGPAAPTSGGELTCFVTREVMREFAPRRGRQHRERLLELPRWRRFLPPRLAAGVGAAVSSSEVARPIQHVDVCATAAEMLAVRAGEMTGWPPRELLS